MGDKPRYSVSAASKANKGSHVKLISLWCRENGMIGGCLSDEISYIHMKSGAKITNDNAWINMKDWEADQVEQPKPAEKTDIPLAIPEDLECPF